MDGVNAARVILERIGPNASYSHLSHQGAEAIVRWVHEEFAERIKTALSLGWWAVSSLGPTPGRRRPGRGDEPFIRNVAGSLLAERRQSDYAVMSVFMAGS